MNVILRGVIKGGVENLGAWIIESGVRGIEEVVPAVLVGCGGIGVSPEVPPERGVLQIDTVVKDGDDNIRALTDRPCLLGTILGNFAGNSAGIVEVPLGHGDHGRRGAAVLRNEIGSRVNDVFFAF